MVRTASDALETANEHGIDLQNVTDDRHEPEQYTVGLVLATSDDPRHAELVEVTNVAHTDDDWEVTVEYPERDAPDGDAYEYTTSFESFVARIEADGGWVEVPHTATKGTARCPSCGSFIHVHDARADFGHTHVTDVFAKGGCDECGSIVDHDWLVDEGVAVELLL
jgi:hypothetical protein